MDQDRLNILTIAVTPWAAAETARLYDDPLTIAAIVTAFAIGFLLAARDLLKRRAVEPGAD